MATTNINVPKIFADHVRQYYTDFYDGKIPVSCDDDCEDDCEGEHGNYDPNVILTTLF